MKNLLLFIIIALNLLFNSAPAFAHDHSFNKNSFITPFPEYEEFVEYLERFSEEAKQYSSPIAADHEKQLGEVLLQQTYEHFKELVELKGEPGITDKTLLYFKTEILPRLNPLKLGKEVLDLAKKFGPRFAITTVSIEILENLTYILAAYDPTYSFLVPVVFFHGYDIVGFTYIFGVPFAFERGHVFNRFGGIRKGPKNFYNFLVKQKESLPIDWFVTLDVQEVLLSQNGKQETVEVVVLKKSLLEKWLSRKWAWLVFPRREAQRKTSNALSITDLESIAKKIDIPLFTYRGLMHDPPVYSRFLIKEISQSSRGLQLLLDRISFSDKLKDSSLNAALILNANNASALTQIGETPDILALRLSWYLLHEAEEIKHSKETHKIDYKILRKIVAIANKDLKRIAETEYSFQDSSAGYSQLMKLIIEVRTMLMQFQSKPKICKNILLNI